MKSAAHPADDLPAVADDQSHVYTIRQYQLPAQIMHWITAVLVFCMFASGVIAKQLGGGAVADTMMSLHKLTGVLVLTLIVLRLIYRATRPALEKRLQTHRRPILHWTLYAVAVLVPLLGWAGISDFGSRHIFAGYSLPAIWPEGAGYDGLLLQYHAYFAFTLLALVALHIGVAIQDYMTDRRPDDAPDGT
jgi:cytochrome b561